MMRQVIEKKKKKKKKNFTVVDITDNNECDSYDGKTSLGKTIQCDRDKNPITMLVEAEVH